MNTHYAILRLLLHYDLLAMAPLNSRGSTEIAQGGWFISFHCNYFGCLSLSFHSFIHQHPPRHLLHRLLLMGDTMYDPERLGDSSRTIAYYIAHVGQLLCVNLKRCAPSKIIRPHYRSTPHTNQTSNPNTMMIILTTLYTRNLGGGNNV